MQERYDKAGRRGVKERYKYEDVTSVMCVLRVRREGMGLAGSVGNAAGITDKNTVKRDKMI